MFEKRRLAQRRQDLAESLDQAGLWRGLAPEVKAEAKTSVAGGAHPWGTEMSDDVQFFGADGEDLAEGGVGKWLKGELAPALERRGVVLDITERIEETGAYELTINGTDLHLFDELTWQSRETAAMAWYDATMRPLAIVNDLLASAGAPERFHVLYAGGNDAVALLIDPAVVDVMNKAGYNDVKERAELPSA